MLAGVVVRLLFGVSLLLFVAGLRLCGETDDLGLDNRSAEAAVNLAVLFGLDTTGESKRGGAGSSLSKAAENRSETRGEFIDKGDGVSIFAGVVALLMTGLLGSSRGVGDWDNPRILP